MAREGRVADSLKRESRAKGSKPRENTRSGAKSQEPDSNKKKGERVGFVRKNSDLVVGYGQGKKKGKCGMRS